MARTFHEECIRECEDGEFIFHEGDQTQEMYIVQTGSVVISKKTPKGIIVLANLGRGDFLGEMSLLESLPRSADAIAKGKTRLYAIQPGGFLLKIRRDPTFAFELLQALSRRIRHTNDQLLTSIKSGTLNLETIKDLLVKV